jgi:hypothetical protein
MTDTTQYTYYTLTALSIRVPTVVKRALTTMQITQFIIGSIFAAIHLFIRYTVPLSRADPFSVWHPSDPTAAAEVGLAQSTPSVTERVFLTASQAARFGADPIPAINLSQAMDSPPRIAIQYQMVHCIDTTGQAFAIWLNVMYLMPLTYLFARFFARSYLRRQGPGAKLMMQRQLAEKASLDALRGVSREIRRAAVPDNEQ